MSSAKHGNNKKWLLADTFLLFFMFDRANARQPGKSLIFGLALRTKVEHNSPSTQRNL